MTNWEKSYVVNNGVLIDCESCKENIGIGNDGNGNLVFKDVLNPEKTLTQVLTGFDVDRILFQNEGELLIDNEFNLLIGV